MNQGNREIALDIFENAWNRQIFDRIEQQISDQMVLHVRNTSLKVDGDGLIDLIKRWHKTMENFGYEIIHIIAEGDLVAINTILHGTPLKSIRGIQPTGSKVSIPHAFFLKFENGKIVKVWEINDFSVITSQFSG